MRLIGHPEIRPIGLDVGAKAVKAVQRLGRRVVTLSLPRDDAPGGAPGPLSVEEAARLKTVLIRRGFRGRDAIIAAPKRAVLSSVLELPPRKSGVPIDKIARSELALAHRREASDMQVASWELPLSPRAGEGVSVLAAGCPHADADAAMDPLEEVGLRVMAMDLEAWALARVCHAIVTTPDCIVAIADIGWSSGSLVLLYQGEVVYERQLPAAGIGTLATALQRDHKFSADAVDYLLFELGFDADARAQSDDWRLMLKGRGLLEAHVDALGKELALSVRYAHHQYAQATVDHVLLCGGGATIPGLAAMLAPIIEAPVSVATAHAAMGLATSPGELASPAMAVAAGLALWQQGEAIQCAA